MPSNNEPISLADKLKALHQIQFALGQEAQPIARACGVPEEIFVVLANECLIEVVRIADEGAQLDMFRIARILPAGIAILAQASVVEPSTLRISVAPHHKSRQRRIYEGTKSGLWDLIKIAFGAGISWYLTHHYDIRHQELHLHMVVSLAFMESPASLESAEKIMKMTNPQFAALLRDVADKIDKISGESKNGRKEFLKQYERIPIPAEVHQESINALLQGLTGKPKKTRNPKTT